MVAWLLLLLLLLESLERTAGFAFGSLLLRLNRLFCWKSCPIGRYWASSSELLLLFVVAEFELRVVVVVEEFDCVVVVVFMFVFVFVTNRASPPAVLTNWVRSIRLRPVFSEETCWFPTWRPN